MITLKNCAEGILGEAMSASATRMVLSEGHGAFFPELGKNDYWRGAIRDSEGNYEFIKVVEKLDDVFIIERAQEGTAAQDWQMGSRVQLRMTAQTWEEMRAETFTRVNGVALVRTGNSSFTVNRNLVSELEEQRAIRIQDSDGNYWYGWVSTASYDAVSGLTTVQTLRTYAQSSGEVVSVGSDLPSALISLDLGIQVKAIPLTFGTVPVSHLNDENAHSNLINSLRNDVIECRNDVIGISNRLGVLENTFIVRQSTAPANKNCLWINTANATLNYYSGSQWVTLTARYSDVN